MALLLNIDTATEAASVCLAKDGNIIQLLQNGVQQDHAAWLHLAIKKIYEQSGLRLKDTDGFSVTIGPGSYTGLRVGLAAVKGFCYTLNKPMIAVNTLLVMAHAVKNEPADLLCPMIDARRMEVFTALYNKDLTAVSAPSATVLTESSFEEILKKNAVCFSGSGSRKFQSLCTNQQAKFSDVVHSAADMIPLTESFFHNKQFADPAYTEPLYLKEFYSPAG